MKTRIELQDDLDMLEAAASGIRHPGPGSQSLLEAIDELLNHPSVDPRDRTWFGVQLYKLRVRHGLPVEQEPSYRQADPEC
jgi:hypothetical protein